MPMIQGDGVELYAEEAGAGHPIVWLHEFAADCRTWEGQIRRFSRSHRCIAYNARGYPPSEVPDCDADYTFEREREDLRAVLDSLGINLEEPAAYNQMAAEFFSAVEAGQWTRRDPRADPAHSSLGGARPGS